MMKISCQWEERAGPIIYVTAYRRTIGFCFCHRKKERSFQVLGLENVLCSRCLGSLAGGITAVVCGSLGYTVPVVWAILFLIPLVFDGLYQAGSGNESTNLRRFITGLLAGWGIVFLGMYCGTLFPF